MAQPHVEAVFAGHVHNFWYDRVGKSEFYMLPSTAFLRHDFSEFFRTAPAPEDEFGRGDLEKFGYMIVDVYESGHVAYSVRTNGRRAAPGEPPAPAPIQTLTHPKVAGLDTIGVELRHPWAESVQITSTGGVQEFGRKWARNDFSHVIRAGFDLSELCQHEGMLADAISRGVIDGITVRLDADRNLIDAAETLRESHDRSRAEINGSIKLAGPSCYASVPAFGGW